MADFDEIYEEEEDEERALEEQLLKYSPDPVVVRGSGHVTVRTSLAAEASKLKVLRSTTLTPVTSADFPIPTCPEIWV